MESYAPKNKEPGKTTKETFGGSEIGTGQQVTE